MRRRVGKSGFPQRHFSAVKPVANQHQGGQRRVPLSSLASVVGIHINVVLGANHEPVVAAHRQHGVAPSHLHPGRRGTEGTTGVRLEDGHRGADGRHPVRAAGCPFHRLELLHVQAVGDFVVLLDASQAFYGKQRLPLGMVAGINLKPPEAFPETVRNDGVLEERMESLSEGPIGGARDVEPPVCRLHHREHGRGRVVGKNATGKPSGEHSARRQLMLVERKHRKHAGILGRGKLHEHTARPPPPPGLDVASAAWTAKGHPRGAARLANPDPAR